MDDAVAVENLNETRLKKILINFEKKYNDNQKLRIKHSESPTKFASSETELFAALDELQSVATQPELYHVLIAKKTLATLGSLLMHENTDISAKVIGMLQEFTDIDDVEHQESTKALINSLREENIVDLLVSNLSRLNETIKEEALAINNTLAIIDNLIDFDSSFASIGSSKKLIDWMVLGQLKKKPEFNSIKLSIAELLSVLLMNDLENKLYLGLIDGIDVLLKEVAHYRRVAPVTGDEHEYLEQLINCLCTAILNCDENRESFYREEGVDLVELVLREKQEAVKKSNIKLSMLKLMNHVLSTDKNRDEVVTKCCERFIQILGLKVIFPIFIQPKLVLSEKVKRREYHQTLAEVEEHSSAILLALLKYTEDNELIQRILVKFAESNFEKLNRLVALHDKYFRLVVSNQQNERDEEDEEPAEEDALEGQGRRGAHFTLRTLDYIILLTCYLSNHFETYEPNSGETFTNRFSHLLLKRPELRHQILLEVARHIEEVGGHCLEEANSLELLVKYFEKVGKKHTIQ